MKILYVCAELPFGKGEAFLIPEVEELLRLNCDIRIVPRAARGSVLHNDGKRLLSRCLAEQIISPRILWGAFLASLRHPGRTLSALATLMQSRDLMTFVKNLAVFPKGLWLGGIALRWKADHIHAHWISTPATMAMVAGTISGVPWSCTAHRVDIVNNNLLSQKMARARFIRFISQSGRAMATALGMKDSNDRAIIMHVGVALPDDVAGERANSNDEPLTVLCAANLYPVKGHQYLIRAVALLHDRGVHCLLKIAGRGECQNDLELLVRELNLADRVKFIGQVSHDDLLAYYRLRQVHIAVLPSVDLGNHLHEGIPVSLMEPMAYGIPVVSTTTGGIPELLSGGAGLLVEEKNPAALADALEKLIVDAGLRKKLAMAGRRRVAECFEVRSITAELLERIQR